MTRKARRTVENIILIEPLLYGLQDKIEEEQDGLIADDSLPAGRVVEKLIALDNRRIDLCNLKVLYGFIERGLGERFALLRSCVDAGANSRLFADALRQIELAGYTTARADEEFGYLFKLIKREPLCAVRREPQSELSMGNAL